MAFLSYMDIVRSGDLFRSLTSSKAIKVLKDRLAALGSPKRLEPYLIKYPGSYCSLFSVRQLILKDIANVQLQQVIRSGPMNDCQICAELDSAHVHTTCQENREAAGGTGKRGSRIRQMLGPHSIEGNYFEPV
jgi:hypothetical protein